MKIVNAKLANRPLKILLEGVSGSGKTFGALEFAKNLGKKQIVVIDTENFSSSLYADEFDFSILNLNRPYTPQKYIDAINMVISSGADFLIIDSISHEWEQVILMVDDFEKADRGKGSGWRKATPLHNGFLYAVIHSPIDTIATVRVKTTISVFEATEYAMEKKVSVKSLRKEEIPLKSVQREGINYEFDIILQANKIDHKYLVTKDRTGMYRGREQLEIDKISSELQSWQNRDADLSKKVGRMILEKMDLEKMKELALKHKSDIDFSNRKWFGILPKSVLEKIEKEVMLIKKD